MELYVLTGEKDQVTVSNNYYGENAYVQDQNGVLRISSYKAKKLVVYVTASDLNSITVYDNSIVKSDGKLALISLDVNLYNNAYAALKLDSYAANITVNDQAKADLTGNVTEYNSTYTSTSTINRAELVAENASEKKIAPKEVVKQASKVEEVVVEDEGL